MFFANVFRFPKVLFLKSTFGAVWSAELHEHGVFLFAVGAIHESPAKPDII